MLLPLILIIAVLLQFLLNFIFQSKKYKKLKIKIGFVLVLITVIGIIYNSHLEKEDKKYLFNQLDTINLNNLKLKDEVCQSKDELSYVNEELMNLNNEYDSLTVLYNLLVAEIKNTGNKTLLELIKTNKSMKMLSNASGVRIITAKQREKMISILSKQKDSEIRIEYAAGDNETAQYARQITYIFEVAGWKISDNKVVGILYMGGPRKEGLYLNVVKNAPAYTYVNNIIEAFNAGGLKFKYKEYKDSHYDFPLKLIVGHIQ